MQEKGKRMKYARPLTCIYYEFFTYCYINTFVSFDHSHVGLDHSQLLVSNLFLFRILKVIEVMPHRSSASNRSRLPAGRLVRSACGRSGSGAPGPMPLQ